MAAHQSFCLPSFFRIENGRVQISSDKHGAVTALHGRHFQSDCCRGQSFHVNVLPGKPYKRLNVDLPVAVLRNMDTSTQEGPWPRPNREPSFNEAVVLTAPSSSPDLS